MHTHTHIHDHTYIHTYIQRAACKPSASPKHRLKIYTCSHIHTYIHKYIQGRLQSIGITKTQIDNLFSFTHSLGLNYTGEWLTPSFFRLTVVNATRNVTEPLPYPPTVVGTNGLKVNIYLFMS